MRDGGKGDKPRPFAISLEKFDAQWEAIFGNKEKNIEPIPFAGMVDTSEYLDVSYHKDGEVITGKVKK